MRILAAQINPTIGDIAHNAIKIIEALNRARDKKADIALFPELALSGYPPEDLLLDNSFIEAIEKKLQEIAPLTKGLFAAIGAPRKNRSGIVKPLYNSAAVFQDGKLLGFHDKELLPTYDVFDEARFFQPGQGPSIFSYMGKKIAVTICEDLWQHSGTVGYTHYSVDPVAELQEKECDLVLNLSSSPYYFGREKMRLDAFSAAAKALQAPLVLCNEAGANDQLIFDGHSFHLDAQGELVQMAKGFAEDDLLVDLDLRLPSSPLPAEDMGDLYQALVLGVRDYFTKQGFRKGVLGLSGGIDSAVVASIAKDALGAKNICALSLPSRFSLPDSWTDAEILADHLGIELKKISIEPMFTAALETMQPYFKKKKWDVAEENLQTRIRGQILMAWTNKFGGLSSIPATRAKWPWVI